MPASPAKLPTLSGASWLRDPRLRGVLAALTAEGGMARIAGGAVRNALMGEPVSDIDIATSEPPERVMALAERAGLATYPVGLAHGTVIVRAGEKPFEVTTLRVDVETYGRHAKVAFTDDWTADAMRRDFTMNALYCDEDGEVFDPVGGYPDIMARRVRFVGSPEERIREDYLRILRFFRFRARYGAGEPDPHGLAACIALRDGIAELSAERIRQEFFQILIAPRAAPTLALMYETGILERVLPGEPDIARLARMAEIDRQSGLAPDALLRLAAMAPCPADHRDRLRLTNAELARLTAMADAGVPSPGLREGERKVVLYHAGPQAFHDSGRLAWASQSEAREEEAWLALLRLPEQWSPPRFPITGEDLIGRGIEPGPELGERLRKLEDWWIASGFSSDKAALLERLSRL